MVASPKRPRILQVLPALDSGGVEHVVVEIAAGLERAGWDCLVASAGGRMEADLAQAGARHATLPLAFRSPWRIWRNAKALARLIETERIDLVHAHSRAPAWSALFACRQAGAAFVTSYHSPYGRGGALKRRYNAVMAKGERVIAVSQFLARLLIACHGTDSARVRVVPNGVNLARFDPQAVTEEQRRGLTLAWNLPAGARVILMPARLTAWKGHEVLIAALGLLSARDWVAVLAGDDQGRVGYVRRLKGLAERLGVAPRLRFPGQIPDMPAALALADVVVNASVEPEGFGRVILEAQAMGRPVIASAHGGAVELIAEGSSGFLVPPADAPTLARAIEQVLALPGAKRQDLAAASRTVAHALSLEAMQKATLAVYAEVLGWRGSS